MKKKSLLAIVLAIVLIATQFSMLLTVSAETTYTALTDRDDFVFGVNVRGNNGYQIYQNGYQTLIDAKSLGSTIVRTNSLNVNHEYLRNFSDVAKQKGIKVMLVDGHIHQFVVDVAYSDLTAESINSIKEYYTNLATSLKGKIAYYQVGNEMDIEAKIEGKSGTKAEHFEGLDTYAVGIYTAINAIKAADPDAKVVVNTSWIDVGFIEGIKKVSIDKTTGLVATSATAAENKTTVSWDLNGIDWYSNGENEDFRNFEDWSQLGKVLNYDYVIEKLSQWNEDVIICESNLWPTEYKEDGSVNYMENADWIAEFVQYAYKQPKVKGFIAYELYDVSAFEDNVDFNKEAHFGLIDKNRVRKDTFGVLQALYGGTDVVREEVTAPGNTIKDQIVKTFVGDPIVKSFARELTEDLFVLSGFEATNINDMRALEFDLYVEDAAAFNSLVNSRNEKMQITLLSGTLHRTIYSVEVGNLVDGWNHFAITKSDFRDNNEPDSNPFGGFKAVDTIRFTFGIDEIEYNPLNGMKIAIANVAATAKVVAPQKAYIGEVIDDGITESTFTHAKWGTGNGNELFYKNNINANLEDLYNKNVYLEFDFYVENKDTVLNTAKIIDFYISTSKYNPWSVNYIKYNLKNQIKQDGWNHIILYYGAANSGNYLQATQTAGDNTPIKSYGIVSQPSAGGSFAGTAIADSYYGFANMKFTQVPETEAIFGEKISSQFTNTTPKAIQWRNYSNGNELFYRKDIGTINLTSTDFNNGDKYIEFDVYIEDLDAILAAAGSGAIDFYISAANGAPWNGNYMKYNIKNQFKNDGWNHIVLKYAWGNSSANVLLPYATPGDPWPIKSYGIACPRNNTLSDTVIFTTPIVTTMRETEAVAGIELDNQFSKNKFRSSEWSKASNGNELFMFNDIGALDVSKYYNKNTYLEFDFYVEDMDRFLEATSNGIVDFYISTETSNPWSNNFLKYNLKNQIKKDGWNHIVLKYGATNANDPAAPTRTAGAYSPIKSLGIVASPTGGNTTFAGTAIANDIYAITNVIFSFGAPDKLISEYTAIGDGKGVYAEIAGGYFVQDLAENIDISTNKMLELDIYVENLSAVSGETYFVLFDANDIVAMFDITAQLVSSEWNHIQIDFDDFMFEGEFEFETVKSWGFINESSDFALNIANLYAADYVIGDANRDGEFDIMDLIRVKKHSLEISNPTTNICAVDFDSDYVISATDCTNTRNELLKK